MGERGEGHVVRLCTSALLISTFAVLAGLCAPAAVALPSCQEFGTTSTCQTNGSVSIKARPGTTAPPANQPGIRWGRGPGVSVTFGR